MERDSFGHTSDIPPALRRWFVVHFLTDVLFALPLLFVPSTFMQAVGWEVVDPVSPRLVGAALLAIGIESWLGRNAGPEAFRAMLNLKIIWASSAILGFLLGIAEGAPAIAWGFVAVFGVFGGVWVYYRRVLADVKGMP